MYIRTVMRCIYVNKYAICILRSSNIEFKKKNIYSLIKFD